MNRMIAAAALAVPLSFGASVPSATASEPTEDPATAAAVRAVTGSLDASAQAGSLPAGFAYAAERGPGYAVNPHGDCSAGIHLPAEFTPACKAHDLGYDLLRHADRLGRPLGSWARPLIDDTFASRLEAACATRPADQRRQCAEVAGLTVFAVRVNTWRQHEGPPRAESARDLAVSWVTGGGRL